MCVCCIVFETCDLHVTLYVIYQQIVVVVIGSVILSIGVLAGARSASELFCLHTHTHTHTHTNTRSIT